MALSGRLSELSPPELLQLVSLTRKTGKLVLSQGDRQGVVIFKQGRIVFAASDTLRSSFSRTLAEGRVVADSTFIEEVERKFPGSTTDSGSFVVQFCDSASEDLMQVVREQIEKTVRELVTWRSGRFVFETVEVPEGEDISLDAGWFYLEEGANPDELLLGALTKLDESERGRWERDIERAAEAPASTSAEAPLKSDISAAFEVLVDEDTGEISWAPVPSFSLEPDRDLSNLRQLMGEMNRMQGLSPSLTADVTLLILRYAAQLVNRGVLFTVREHVLQGIGQFGLRSDGQSADERVRKLRIPLDSTSVLALTVGSRSPFVGRLPEGSWSHFLIEALGGAVPFEVVAVPLVVEDTVVALFYGDNVPHAAAIGSVDGLEILMHEIGLGVEKARLERKLERLERDDSGAWKRVDPR